MKTLERTKEIRLWEHSGFEEINSIIAGLFVSTKFGSKLNAAQVFEQINEKGFGYFANLKFTNDKAEMYSGCCFDFPDWHELLEITREKSWVWLGHDPTTYIEYRSAQDKLIVWRDEKFAEKKSVDEKDFIEFSFREFKLSVIQLKKDLMNFSVLLDIWSEQMNENSAQELAEKIKVKLGICKWFFEEKQYFLKNRRKF